jgi:hypothetical protein
MAPLISYLNLLLPFATPGTPLLQDLVHLGAICLLFYFGPQIQGWLQRRQNNGQPTPPTDNVDTDEEIVPHIQQDVAGELEEDDENPGVPEAQPQDVVEVEGEPGPARPRDVQTQRNVGTKKAKSLARKDQRRAYHEFMRSQGDAQRARDADGASEREKAQAAEKERRKAAEMALETKKTKEREQQRRKDEAERQEEIRRRELALQIVRDELQVQKACSLWRVAIQIGDEVDKEWVEQVLQTSNVIGRQGDAFIMITSTGWVVKVTAADMELAYKKAVAENLGGNDGMIDNEALAGIVESVIK